ncbi:MAG TPA: hypothetical protein VGX03_39860 [Candidatus Binatia bacterium]|jgi:hypothetical protein|nr:hypothetical protein [Candidatus Binatia bacterium]
MEHRKILWRTWLVVVATVLALTAGPAVAATLVVDDDGFASATDCNDLTTATFTTISAAVAAASSGDTILVCPGTYPEQVVITKDLTLLGDPGATIAATFGAVGAMVDVSGTTVIIAGFTINGNGGAGRSGCQAGTNRFSGIRYHDQASGAIAHNTVVDIHLPAGLLGCQEGVGIEIRDLNASDGATAVAVTNNTVVAYQKGGIVANGEGVSARVAGNTVVGFGPTNVIAQNGIQFGFGAAGTADGNYIQGNFYTPATFASAGILVFGFQQGSNVQIPNTNVFVGNQVDILRGPVCGQCVQ